MTTREVIEIYQGLQSLINNNTKAYPGKIAYAINRNFRKLAPIVEDYDKARMDLVIERGRPDPDNEGVFIIDKLEDREFLNDQTENLLSVENEDVKLLMIKYADIENVDFSFVEMNALYPMISEEE